MSSLGWQAHSVRGFISTASKPTPPSIALLGPFEHSGHRLEFPLRATVRSVLFVVRHGCDPTHGYFLAA
jgi:hypothetical protein